MVVYESGGCCLHSNHRRWLSHHVESRCPDHLSLQPPHHINRFDFGTVASFAKHGFAGVFVVNTLFPAMILVGLLQVS